MSSSVNEYIDLLEKTKDILDSEDVVEFFIKLSSEEIDYLYHHDNPLFIKFILKVYEKDKEAILKRLLDDKVFYNLYHRCEGLSSLMYDNVDYDLIRDYVIKDVFYMNNKNVSKEIYQKLLNDLTIDERHIIYLINGHLYPDVISEFFQKSIRSMSIFNGMSGSSIFDCIIAGVVFSKKQLTSRHFFNALKIDSIIKFRDRVNLVTSKIGYLDIEKQVFAYYDEILKTYDSKTKVFDVYMKLLDNLNQKGYVNLEILEGNSLLYDSILGAYGLSKDKLEGLTSRKISDIVIDYLFKDNYHNVMINLNEMLNYNRIFGNRLIQEETANIFRKFLAFDKISSEEKIELFYALKDKKVDVLYYDTLRMVKNYSYQNINKVLLKLDVNNKDSELSYKYGVDVYDYREKAYYLLVRTIGSKWSCETDKNHECFSLISNENTEVYNNGLGHVYGYDTMDEGKVMHVFEDDSYSSEEEDVATKTINRIMVPDEIVLGGSGYSEIQIKNKKIGDNLYLSPKPSYVIAIGKIEFRDVDESKRLGIPIILIKENIKHKFQEFYVGLLDYTYSSSDDEAKRNHLR